MSRFGLSLILALLVSPGAWSQEPEPAKPLAFQGYPDARAYTVEEAQNKSPFFPCQQCHQYMEPNPQPRKLAAPHVLEIKHGGGRIWCLACHHRENRNKLRTLLDEEVEFDQSYIVCGSCHADRQRDWFFGGHGKRLADWDGERRLYNCVHCHNPHEPPIKPRKPSPAPTARTGLRLHPAEKHESNPPWQRDEQPH